MKERQIDTVDPGTMKTAKERQMDDHDIIKLFLERNEQAIQESDRKCGDYLGSQSDSKESVSDTYLSARNSIPLRKPNTLAPYLGRIVWHISVNRWIKNDAFSNAAAQKLPRKKIGLIAVIAAVLLLLTGCAAFAIGERNAPLSESQVDHIESQTPEHPSIQTCDGFSLELKSTISESKRAYVTFGLTAPEDVDLSGVLDIRIEERLSFPNLLATTSGCELPANLSYDVVDNGDGKKNTLDIVLQITPVLSPGEESPFDQGQTCNIAFREIIMWGYDREYEQELLNTKYAGQTNNTYTQEESRRLHPETVLASGDWIFDIALSESDPNHMILLDSPLPANVLVIRTGTTEFETVQSIESVTLTSVSVSPLCVEISFERPEPFDTFDCIYVDATMLAPSPQMTGFEYGSIVLVMKDGTKIGLFQYDGAKETAVLCADRPIVMDELDYLLMSDGTKITAQ